MGLNIDRYIRYGYLQQDDNDQLYLDWRTHAEVDERALINLLLNAETNKGDSELSDVSEEDSEVDEPEDE